ncbi:MAG: PSD1 and planctomycete cytochrome C domain-containing protein [Verrucomicrobiota bacterium]
MKRLSFQHVFWPVVALGLPLEAASDGKVEFGREILPILSDRCFHCHGQDEKSRKADLRLDSLEEAMRDLGGYKAIEPGNPEKSALIQRMVSKDPDEVMPPPKAHKEMKASEVELFRKWISQGAKYDRHWSFVAVKRPEVPVLEGDLGKWVRNPVDAFVAKRLEREGLKPSPEASVSTLARRVALDLTGLPPSLERVAALEKEMTDPKKREAAWLEYGREQFRSPHYGERMGMFWLDASRYSDTDGFQADATRTNWPWRDWVVESFNRNQPFDQFTLEQFAGDLLPEATPEQKMATCFHRNHMTNGEGGRDPEESRVDYVLDRVNTTGTLWLGLTMGCAQCHTHKYDPILQSQYYQLSAFFNSINETGAAGKKAEPYLPYQSAYAGRAMGEAQKLVDLRKTEEKAAAKLAEPEFEKWLAQQRRVVAGGFNGWRVFEVSHFESGEGATLSQNVDGVVVASGKAPEQDDYRLNGVPGLKRMTGLKLEVLPDAALPMGGASRADDGVFVLTDIKVQIRAKGATQGREVNVVSAVADYSADTKKHNGYGSITNTFDDDPRNGWANFDTDPKTPHTAVWAFSEPEELAENEEVVVELRQRALEPRRTLGRFRLWLSDQPGPAPRILDAAPLEQLAEWSVSKEAGLNGGKVPDKLRGMLRDQFLADHAPYRPFKEALERATSQLADTREMVESTKVMVMEERAESRKTYVLQRGQWDKQGDAVEPGVPTALASWHHDDRSGQRTRVGLAKWLTDPNNPLTARVVVNNLWQILFGEGLVRTPEDFGVQGELPTHPELLDWLAAELMENGWNLRHVIRVIITSATYRQDSKVSGELLNRDPANRLLARGSRFRMPAWMLRDSALKISGLLNPIQGGPPVRPYQPAGVWEDITMGRFKYRASEGSDQYRRTLYAFWRRSASPAFLFDSAQRRVCEVRAPRTNTPLQALTLMNDTTYLESARVLAERVCETATPEPSGEIFERVLLRKAKPDELAVLQAQYAKALDWYLAHPQEAERAVHHGQSVPSPKLAAPKLAATTLIATLVLNMDEAITRE